ncbi:MAG: HEPN domain-containing protein [Ignavibacteria bacterium]|nr:HEPN domain-containing protein [Ignavibacteria bacterium]
MNEQNSIQHWISTAEYDIKTAEAMFDTKRFLYVGFMCHLVIEKMLKGYFVKIHNANPPYTHNLQYLAEKSGIFLELSEEQLDFFDTLQPLNIRARYPSAKDELFKLLTEDRCKKLIEETKEMMIWIKNKL